jgi:organic radical activating enzyme
VGSSRAALVEVFHSVQGEGRFIGVPMSFVRVATCPLRCLYCDTPESYRARPTFAVRAGGGERAAKNPVDVASAIALLREVRAAAGAIERDPVSVTGGEPLVYPRFVRSLGDALDAPLHLETAALHPEALAHVLPAVAHVSADYKLRETLPQGDHSDAHVRCIAAAADAGKSLDVKVVLTAAVAEASLRAALARLLPFRQAMLLVLQPVTPFGAVIECLPRDRLLRFLDLARAAGFEARVLPQAHKALALP